MLFVFFLILIIYRFRYARDSGTHKGCQCIVSIGLYCRAVGPNILDKKTI